MDSSAFDSFNRTPGGAWATIWLSTVLLSLILLGSYELFWRTQGFEPHLQDSTGLWVQQRKVVSNRNQNTVAFVGTSRLEALDPVAFESVYDNVHAIQLSISGEKPQRVFQDLAKDPAFHGVVIYDVLPDQLFREGLEKIGDEVPLARIDAYHNRKWISDIQTNLSVRLAQRLVLPRRTVSPRRVAARFLHGYGLPEPANDHVQVDRRRLIDFRGVNTRPAIDRRVKDRLSHKPASWQVIDKRIDEFNRNVRRIRARGGEVVFFRTPSDDELRTAEETIFPRRYYWDRFATAVEGVALHFEDISAMANVECPDDSHIDYRSSESVSRALASELKKRMILPRQTK